MRKIFDGDWFKEMAKNNSSVSKKPNKEALRFHKKAILSEITKKNLLFKEVKQLVKKKLFSDGHFPIEGEWFEWIEMGYMYVSEGYSPSFLSENAFYNAVDKGVGEFLKSPSFRSLSIRLNADKKGEIYQVHKIKLERR
jgi:hypothetical protein